LPVELYFPVFAQLLAQVAAERGQMENHKALLQQRDITGNGRPVYSQQVCQLIVRDLVADLQSQRLQKAVQIELS
jgi:hypothetical protein